MCNIRIFLEESATSSGYIFNCITPRITLALPSLPVTYGSLRKKVLEYLGLLIRLFETQIFNMLLTLPWIAKPNYFTVYKYTLLSLDGLYFKLLPIQNHKSIQILHTRLLREVRNDLAGLEEI